MKTIKIISLLLFSAINGYCQKYNTDAISNFWKIVDYLKTDKPLTDSVWNAYYNVAGNKNYMENNRSENQVLEHRKYLEFVFRPSFSDSLKTVESLQNKNNFDDIFQNLLFIKKNEPTIRAYSKEIQSPKYLLQSTNLAKKFLPKNKYNSIPNNITIYLMAITYDAAVQDSSMYFGLSIVYDIDRFQKGAMAAHELHHVLRKEKKFRIPLSKIDSTTANVVGEINNEGCADNIDKPIIVEYSSKLVLGTMIKEWLFLTAETAVKKLDSCFILNSKNNLTFVTISDFDKIINYSSGHIPGYYMTDIIKRNGYLKELIAHSDNQFNFFFLYNKAALQDKSKPPLFSQETIDYLKELEKKLL